MTARLGSGASILLIALALTGCSGAQGSGAQGPGAQSSGDQSVSDQLAETAPAAEEAASAVPTDLGDATAGDEDLDGEADAGALMTGEKLCAFLAEEAPQVADLAPPEYAAATFGSAVFTFYSDNGLLTDIDGADMDALVAEGCPQTAAQLLPVLGAESFTDLFSQ